MMGAEIFCWDLKGQTQWGFYEHISIGRFEEIQVFIYLFLFYFL
jgi:hypothetical protein